MEKLIIESCDSAPNVIESDEPDVLSQIYKPEVNIVIWRRKLSPALILEVQNLLFYEKFEGSRTTIEICDSHSYLKEIICGKSNTLVIVV